MRSKKCGDGQGQMVVLPGCVRKANLVHNLCGVQQLCGWDGNYGQQESAE